jgi:hypothetical protein
MNTKAVNELFELMSAGIVPDFCQVMAALSELTELETLKHRPGEKVEPFTTCQIYKGHACNS